MLKNFFMFVALSAVVAFTCGEACAASADDTRVVNGSGVITDSTGARWSINSGYIYVNGIRDVHSANVICLAYEGGRMWQENASHMWYDKIKSTDTWAPSSGTSNSPLPPITATVSGGYLKVRTDPQTVVGITAIGSNNTYLGSTSQVTDSYGTLQVPTTALFGHNNYLVSEFRRPMLLSNAADIAMFSIESYASPYNNFDINLLSDTYGANVQYLDWTTLVSLQSSNPTSFAYFAKSLGNNQAYILYNGNYVDQNYNPFVVKTYRTQNTIASISNVLYLDIDTSGRGKVAYYNFGSLAYTFNTVANVRVVVP